MPHGSSHFPQQLLASATTCDIRGIPPAEDLRLKRIGEVLPKSWCYLKTDLVRLRLVHICLASSSVLFARVLFVCQALLTERSSERLEQPTGATFYFASLYRVAPSLCLPFRYEYRAV